MNNSLKSGITPTKRDHRDLSFKRTFGQVNYAQLPDDYTCDAGLGFPDQNADGLGNGCSGYTQSELCGDEDFAQYKPRFTYEKTLYMDDQPFGEPCDLRTSLKSTIVYGVQGLLETTDAEASQHRRGRYYNVTDGPGDSFDDMRDCLWHGRLDKRAISCGTPWYAVFGTVGPDGILSKPLSWDTTYATWHNHKVCGWKTINGIPYLISKSWQGPNCGDKGYVYISRALFNGLMAVEGSVAYTLIQSNVQDIQTIQWDIALIFQTISNYIKRLFNVV